MSALLMVRLSPRMPHVRMSRKSFSIIEKSSCSMMTWYFAISPC